MPILEAAVQSFHTSGVQACAKTIHRELLGAKVKFPLLEYTARTLADEIPDEEQLEFCDAIEAFQTEGGNVLLGIFLQLRLDHHFEASLTRAASYIANGRVWYVSDIIGERVYGVALLRFPERMIPWLAKLDRHPSTLVVRSLGAGCHYAIKKGLEPIHVESVFRFLLTKARATDHQIRQGIGWAAKTTAKFHPDLIAECQDQIDDPETADNWFRRKVAIGLMRHQHAQRNSR